MKNTAARPTSATQNRRPSDARQGSSSRVTGSAKKNPSVASRQNPPGNDRAAKGKQSPGKPPASQNRGYSGRSSQSSAVHPEKADAKSGSSKKNTASQRKKADSRPAKPPKRPKNDPPRPPRRDGVLSLLIFAFFRHFQKRFGSFLSCCICILSLYASAALIFTAVYAGFFFGNTLHHDDVIYLYTDGTEDEKHPAKERRLSYDSVFRNGEEPYVNMTELSEILGLIIVGNNRQLRFCLPDAPDSSVLFTKDSRNAVVNGCNSVILTSPAKISGRTVYVPVSFLQNYTTGFGAAYDPVKNCLTVERLVDEKASTEQTLAHIPFTYTMGNIDPLEAISEEETYS